MEFLTWLLYCTKFPGYNLKIQTTMIRLITFLLVLALCLFPASAVNILNEQDIEVMPDYSRMDAETAITT